METDVNALQLLPVLDDAGTDEMCCATYLSIVCTGTFGQRPLADRYGDIG